MAVANHKIKGAHAGLSGHVSYTAQQHNFWGMIDRRNNRIEVMRKHGTLPTKQVRNPMRAEKTPRRDDHGHFDFSIPTGRKELKDFHRWDYPESDFGLMGKFATQKDKYELFKGTQKEYIEKMKAKAAYEKELEEQLRREAEEIAERANMPSARSSAREEETPRSARTARDPYELDMHKEKIANFRLLGQVEPRVLEKYRAERAKEFLRTYHEEQSNPLDPPRRRKEKNKKPFLPSGTTDVLDDGVPPPLEPDFQPIGGRTGKKVRGGFSPTQRRGGDKSKTAALNHLVGQLDTAERDILKAEARLEALRTQR